jgi:hypothetical protein
MASIAITDVLTWRDPKKYRLPPSSHERLVLITDRARPEISELDAVSTKQRADGTSRATESGLDERVLPGWRAGETNRRA